MSEQTVWDRKCAVAACDREAFGRQEYCRTHHVYWRRTGKTPTHAVNSLRPITTYSGVHNRLEVTRGKASQYPCIVCGEPAADWAYNNRGAEERIGPAGRYSLDLSDYDPMCRGCHCKLDKALVTQCPEGHAYEGTNLAVRGGKRYCRACARSRRRRYRKRPR